MTARRPSKAESPQEPAAPAGAPVLPYRERLPAGDSLHARRLSAPISRDDAEQRYLAARDAWTDAMRRAQSGRAADLATLALSQEAYEEAAAEMKMWRTGQRVAIPVESKASPARLNAVVGQELAWRRVHQVPARTPSLLARLLRRLTGRG